VVERFERDAVITFLHRYVAGIRLPDGVPGYRRFRIEPQPGGGITWAQARHDSPYGRIESAWRLDGGTFELALTVPPGTTAEVGLPDGSQRTVAPGRHTLRGPAPRP
jgi:alpha-L-rhamnosidase